MRDVFGARDDQVGHFFAFLWLFGGHAAGEKSADPARYARKALLVGAEGLATCTANQNAIHVIRAGSRHRRRADGANRERVLFEQDEVEVEFRRNAEANRRLPLKLAVFIACLRMRCENANFSAKVGV